MCNSERVPTLLFLYTSDWSPNWVSSCRHIERGDLRDVLRCFKKFVCLRAVCFDKILSLHLFFAMSASAFSYSMPVDTLELRPFAGLTPTFSLSPTSDVDIEDISLLVFTILDWFCKLAYLLLNTSGRERLCVVWHCHHRSRVGAQNMFTSKHMNRFMVSLAIVVIVIVLDSSNSTYGALLRPTMNICCLFVERRNLYNMFCSCRVLSSRATEDEDPHASHRCWVAFVPYGAQRVRKDNDDRRNGYVVI